MNRLFTELEKLISYKIDSLPYSQVMLLSQKLALSYEFNKIKDFFTPKASKHITNSMGVIEYALSDLLIITRIGEYSEPKIIHYKELTDTDEFKKVLSELKSPIIFLDILNFDLLSHQVDGELLGLIRAYEIAMKIDVDKQK